MILMILLLAAGIFLLVKGADLFVDGACELSEKLKIPAYLVGLTVVALGTSLPEAAVSITAAIDGSNEIAIGNVIGSNMFNTLVVLGSSALFAPIIVKRNLLRRDFPFCLGITVLLAVLLAASGASELTRAGGAILLIMFAAFMTYSIILGKKGGIEEDESAEIKNFPMWKCLLFIVVGMAGVAAGGALTVNGAKMMAQAFGLSETVIGLTVVAIGTSLPELVTSIVAAKKKQNDIAIGNVIGSNVFNILFILGISSVISPITPKDAFVMTDAVILTGVMLLTFVMSLFGKKINRPMGIFMILIYAAYMAFLLVR